jgi:single-strand DNA-binding protein
MENNYQRLIGFLGKDPEFGTYGENRSYCRLSVPTSNRYRDSSGQWTESETTWHDVVVYKPFLLKICQGLGKGHKVMIIGSLSKKKYNDANQVQRTKVSTVASEIIHLVHNFA